ncbi:MAG: hypothetical protein IJ799_08265 [Bacteroidales bacterium]|nr:hypothetical protein [Bacteroidales bacterium]
MKLKTVLIFAAALVAAVSCGDGNVAALYEGADGFAFPSGIAYVEVGPEDEGRMLLPIHRSGFGVSVAKVELKTERPDGFEDPGSNFSLLTPNVVFPDGALTSNVQIRIADVGKMSLTGKYRLVLRIKDDLTPSGRGELLVTASRRLTFEPFGRATVMDNCMFDKAYETDIMKAAETDAYRVMDPYRQGLVAEDYAAEGWMQDPPAYIQFLVADDGSITYEPFRTGMKVNGKYMAWACHPSAYTSADFSSKIAENKRLSEKVFQLYPVYYLPDVHDGYLNDGAYPLVITVL